MSHFSTSFVCVCVCWTMPTKQHPNILSTQDGLMKEFLKVNFQKNLICQKDMLYLKRKNNKYLK